MPSDLIRLERFSLPTVKADWGKLFSKLGAAVAHGGGALLGGPPGGIATAVAHIFGAAEAVSLETPLETVAWRLIHEGTKRALVELLRPLRRPKGTGDMGMAGTATAFGESLRQDDLDLEPGFLRNPSASPIARHLKADFGHWLEEQGFDANERRDLLGRFDAYFVRGLHDAWREDAAAYERLSTAFDSPFAAAARLEQDWFAYQTRLAGAMSEPVFQETFSIGDVYIPLRGSYREPLPLSEEERAARRYTDGKPGHRTVIVDLESDFREWRATATADTAIRILRGAPGSGKSTVARKLATDVAADFLSAEGRMRVILIPLQRFRVNADLGVALRDYLCGPNRPFRENPLAQEDFATAARPLLLVFDGLDELGLEGKERDKETSDVLRTVRDYVRHHNGYADGPARILALVTGRTVVVQATGEALRAGDRQELTVLSYAPVPSEERRSPEHPPVFDPAGLAEKDQRRDWWRRYRIVRPGEPAEMPETLMSSEVAELSAEPLLNYLLVLSGHHRDTEEPGPAPRNRIYGKLMRQVLDGVHGGGKAPRDGGLTDDDVETLLETVAAAAWYGGDGRGATVEDVRRACPDEAARTKLDAFLKATGGLVGLVAAFFFQEAEGATGRRGSFEFTHKSFGDYLTARRIVRQIREAHDVYTTWERKGRQEKGVIDASQDWVTHFGDQMLTWEVVHFLMGEVALCGLEEPDAVAGWQATFTALFQRMLDQGLPVLEGSDTFRHAEQRSRNAQVSLFAVLSACGEATGTVTTPRWPDQYAAGTLILSILGQVELFSTSSLICDHFNLTGQILWRLPRSPTSMRGAGFHHADLSRANLSYANLSYADLSYANLAGADMSGAHLSDANLSHARLSGAYLPGAKLAGANLSSAYMASTYLPAADLSGADLSGVNLTDADLSGANLTNANLSNADLLNVDLSDADLLNVDLSDANLSGVKLSETNLSNIRSNAPIRNLGTHPSHTALMRMAGAT